MKVGLLEKKYQNAENFIVLVTISRPKELEKSHVRDPLYPLFLQGGPWTPAMDVFSCEVLFLMNLKPSSSSYMTRTYTHAYMQAKDL